MSTDAAPPIPLRLTDRPTAAGLVVPVVTPQAGRRWLFGLLDADLRDRCLSERRCQICGDPLGPTLVLLLRESDLPERCTSEPALHPECAAYTQRACPMIAGRMNRYRATAHPLPPGYASTDDRPPSADPVDTDRIRALLADLGVLSPPDGSSPTASPAPAGERCTGSGHAGAAAEPWHTVWLHAYDIEPDVRSGQLAASYRNQQPLTIRPVQLPDAG